MNNPPSVVNPLSVSVNSEGKPRLILDLRHVNKCIPKAKFRLEDWRIFLQYTCPQGYMVKFDMKSGYHHIDIHDGYQQYLGFQWPLSSTSNRYFCFTVLPFGLSSAPFLFTKFFRPLVRHWRSLGFHMVLYLDDGIVCEKDNSTTLKVSTAIRFDLARAGIVANCDKSIWSPTQTIEWLGITWDLASGSLSIPQGRINRLISSLKDFKFKLPSVSFRFLASVVGRIVSLSPCVGNMALIMSRFLQSAIAFREGWDSVVDLSRFQFYSNCLDEVDFWLSNCERLNRRLLFAYSQPVVVIHSDASAHACGGSALVIDKLEFELFYRALSSMESIQDSNARELLSILYALKSFKPIIRGHIVKIYTDNANAAIISRKGSMSMRLHRFAIDIFQFCAVNNVSLEIEWIPRSLNQFADTLSRVQDFDDWAISVPFFHHVSDMSGPFTVDRFASTETAKCARFFSKFWCPGTEGVDAFSVDWSGDNNWLVPPPYLVPRTIFHLEDCSAVGTLVIPKWPSSYFWPVVFPMGSPRSSVSRIVEFSDPTHIFAPARPGHNTIFSNYRFNAPVLVVCFDASRIV